MVDLPIELWYSIFDHLPLVDFFSCALVSKAVYLAVKEYRIREIAFTGRVYRWFHYTTSIIDQNRRIDFTMVSILRRSSFNFDYLKRLKIGQTFAIDLEEINRFVHLEELDIDLKYYKEEKSRTLSLANLKVLYLFVPDRFSYLELDCPRLAKVCTFILQMLDFVHPQSIRCIHTFFHNGKLPMFPNLEFLAFTDHYNQLDFSSHYSWQAFDEFSLPVLKNLKEIDFNYHQNCGKVNMRNLKEAISNLLVLGWPDLKVFWQNVQVTDANLLTEYERTIEFGSLLVFQLQHYEELREIDCFWDYDFNGSMRKLSRAGFNLRTEKFISKFLARYSFRRIVIEGMVEEREILLELITRSPSLLSLEFEKSPLGQSFFDLMADTIQLNGIPLQILIIKKFSNRVLDFEFVLRLRDLELFQTDQQLPSKLISNCLLELPMLTEIEFSFGQSIYRIARISGNRFLWNEKPLSKKTLVKRLNRLDLAECGLM